MDMVPSYHMTGWAHHAERSLQQSPQNLVGWVEDVTGPNFRPLVNYREYVSPGPV